jgi:hypothetical protein
MAKWARRKINARDVAPVVRDPDAVEFYKNNPNGTYDGGFLASNGGTPRVGRGRGGRLVAWEGNHRIAAAAAQGKKITVEYLVEDEPRAPKKNDSFFAWMFR